MPKNPSEKPKKNPEDYPKGRGRNGALGIKRPDIALRMKGKKLALGLTKDVCPNNGRPTKYTEKWIDEEADILLKWIEEDKGIYIGSFAVERGYCRQKLSDFAKQSAKFMDAMEKARTWQENKFLKNDLTREWDAAQVRYTMARVCGDIWKASYDREDSDSKDITLNININKIER
mgnify:FL=1